MLRRWVPLLMIAAVCFSAVSCRSTPLRITSTPPGARGTLQCGSRVVSVVTPASATLPPGGGKPCLLTLSKEGYEPVQTPVAELLTRADIDPTAEVPAQITDRDRPFLHPVSGGIWPEVDSPLPAAVQAERRRAIHIVLRPVNP